MNKRERVIAAFHGKEVDHVPVCMWQHVPPEYWDDDDKFAKCQLDAYKHTDVDFVKLSADKYFGWPDPVLNGISSAKQLYDMKPLGAEHPFIRGQIERTKFYEKAAKAYVTICTSERLPYGCIILQKGVM